jgi:hypothetical protein
MHQSPRLLQGSNGRAGRSNGPQPTIAGSLPPTTPHHPRNGAALDNLIISLENEWHLGLKLRGSHWSPQKTDEKSMSDKVYGQIKRLHYGAKPELNALLDNFRSIAPGFAHEKRLELLNGLLKSKTQSPISRAGTPLSEPPKSLKSVQPLCKCATASLLCYFCKTHVHMVLTPLLPASHFPVSLWLLIASSCITSTLWKLT